jgi:ParB family chromosome partitioning protein
VTLATALIEAPDWLLQAYREGRCRGMNELYELRRLHGEHAEVVEAWAAEERAITRDRIAELRATLTGDADPDASHEATSPARAQHSDKRIHVEFDGQDYQLVVSVAPEQPGHVYVRPLVGGPRRLAPASALKLLGFVSG